MDKLTEVKLSLMAIIGGLSAFWGWFGWLVIAFIGCMALDYVTGTAVAIRKHDWASKEARDGIWHKLGSLIAVIVAMVADGMIGMMLGSLPAVTLPFTYTVLLAPLVLAWYILTELGSIIENAYKLGAPVPKFLKSLLRLTRQAVDAAGDKLAGKEETQSKKPPESGR